MNLNQFLAELRLVNHAWELDPDGCITSDDDGCPINEVWLATEEGDDEGPLGSYADEAQRLGLLPTIADKIAEAADGKGNSMLRKALLEACGLTGHIDY